MTHKRSGSDGKRDRSSSGQSTGLLTREMSDRGRPVPLVSLAGVSGNMTAF